MEDILELILSILFMPFESKYDNLKNKTPKTVMVSGFLNTL